MKPIWYKIKRIVSKAFQTSLKESNICGDCYFIQFVASHERPVWCQLYTCMNPNSPFYNTVFTRNRKACKVFREQEKSDVKYS